jgi:hypothetical protein
MHLETVRKDLMFCCREIVILKYQLLSVESVGMGGTGFYSCFLQALQEQIYK